MKIKSITNKLIAIALSIAIASVTFSSIALSENIDLQQGENTATYRQQIKNEMENDKKQLTLTKSRSHSDNGSAHIYSFSEISNLAYTDAEETFNFFVSSALRMPEIFPGLSQEDITSLRLGKGFSPMMLEEDKNPNTQIIYFPILGSDGKAIRNICITMEDGEVAGVGTSALMVETYNLMTEITCKDNPGLIFTNGLVMYVMFPDNNDINARSYLTESTRTMDEAMSKRMLDIRSEVEGSLLQKARDMTVGNKGAIVEISYEGSKPLTIIPAIEETTMQDGTEERAITRAGYSNR